MYSNEIAVACSGKLYATSNIIINKIVFHSKEVVPNSLFICIKGENHDGHNFIKDCMHIENTLFLVSHIPDYKVAMILVQDTEIAMLSLAKYYRQQFSCPIVALTGSNGKTTVKEMLKQIFTAYYGNHILSSFKNYNNRYGVAHSLFNLFKDCKLAVLEIGMNHAGEIRELVNIIAPDLVLINNVQLAHIGFFADLQEIARAKFEICEGLPAKGTAVLNSNLRDFDAYNHLQQDINIVNFGSIESGFYLQFNDEDNVLVTPNGSFRLNLQLLGKHNYFNALAATAVATQFAVPLKVIKTALEEYSGVEKRLQIMHGINNSYIINDAYNANPDSVKAAVIAINSFSNPRWMVLGQLNELGRHSNKLHKEIVQFIHQNGISMLLMIGDALKQYANGINCIYFDSIDDIVNYCIDNLPHYCSLLIKGSNSYKLWLVAERLLGD